MPLNVPLRVSNKAQPYAPAAERNGPLQIPLQSTDVPVGAFGMNRAKALADFGQQAGQASKVMLALSQKLQAERDDAWSDQQFSSFLDWSSDYSNNPDYGVYSKKGENAQNVVNTAAQDYDKKIDTLLSKAPSLQAQQLLEAKVRQARNADLGMFARHSANELRSWRLEMKSTAVDKAIDGMIGKWTADPEETEAQWSEQVAPQLADLSAMTGKPVETLEYETKGKLFASIVEMNADSDQLGRASSLLSRWKDFIPAKLQVKLQSHIKARGEALAEKGRAAAERNALENNYVIGNLQGTSIFNQTQFSPDDPNYLSPSQATQAILALDKGDKKSHQIAQATLSRFNALISAQKMQEEEEFKTGLSTAYDALSAAANDPVKAEGIHNGIKDPKIQKALNPVYKEILAGNGMRTDTSPKVWSEAMDKIYYADITDERDLMATYAGQMPPAAFKVLAKELTDAQKIEQGLARRSFLAALGKDTEMPLSMLNSNQKEDFYTFYSQLREKAKLTNRANDQEWVDQQALYFMRSGQTKEKWGFGYGRDINRMDITGKADQIPDATEEEKAQIRAILKADPGLRKALADEFGETNVESGYLERQFRKGSGKRTGLR